LMTGVKCIQYCVRHAVHRYVNDNENNCFTNNSNEFATTNE